MDKKIQIGLINLIIFFSSLYSTGIYQDSWAVIIGINDYPNIKKLNYAVDDAQDIYKLLTEKFHFPEENITLLIDEDATYQNIRTQLYETAEKVGNEDRLVFFFAGHGTQKELHSGGEKGFLIPVDGDTSKIFLTAIDMNEIKNISEITRAKHVLFLMDACYGGLMAVSSRSLDTKTPGYMKKITRDKGRQIITAGGKDEEAQERPEWGHSAFTKNIIRGLDDEMADANDDGYITASELGNYLQEKVTIDSDYLQTPQIQRYGTGEGEFVFVGTAKKEPEIEISKTEPVKETPPKAPGGITADQLERALNKFAVRYGTLGGSSGKIEKSSVLGSKTQKEWKLLFGDTEHIGTDDVSGKWIEFPEPRFNYFNRVDGIGLGFGNSFTRVNPFSYRLKLASWYNFSRQTTDYSVNFKRYLWNREYQFIETSIYQQSKTYDDWSVLSDLTHQWGSAFWFNVDHFDYYLGQGYSIMHSYYNQDGFSIAMGFRTEKQDMLSKTTDFSVFRYGTEYRENYYSTEEHFTSGTLTSLNLELGFNGAVPEYNFLDNKSVEIFYELNPLDIPIEYQLNNYNIINTVSNTLGSIDSLHQDTVIYANLLGGTIQILEETVSSNWFQFESGDSTSIQGINFSIPNPNKEKTEIRFYGTKLDNKGPASIFLNKVPVEEGKSYIFSFWVRTVKDTMIITPGISKNQKEGLVTKEWANIGPEWQRVWVTKKFDGVGDNPRVYISTNETAPIYIWGVQLEEVPPGKDDPTEYQPTDGKPLEVWLVAESSNWVVEKIQLIKKENNSFFAEPILARGRYAYRFQIDDNLFNDPNAKKTGTNKNGEIVSILEVGLKPKWNLGLEFSDPALGSDFSYNRISSNLRFTLPISYTEVLYFRLINGYVTEKAPPQRYFYLGNVGSLRAYNIKELDGRQLTLINMEYHINIFNALDRLGDYEAKSLKAEDTSLFREIFPPGIIPIPNLKPFLFYDIGVIGNELNEENTYTSAGIGLEVIGIRLMAAKRLDRVENSWSVLFDFGGFFNRWEYLP